MAPSYPGAAHGAGIAGASAAGMHDHHSQESGVQTLDPVYEFKSPAHFLKAKRGMVLQSNPQEKTREKMSPVGGKGKPPGEKKQVL